MESRDSISDIWGPRTPHEGEWRPRVDTRTVEEPEHWVQSACIYCSTGCGIDLGVKDGRIGRSRKRLAAPRERAGVGAGVVAGRQGQLLRLEHGFARAALGSATVAPARCHSATPSLRAAAGGRA